MWGVRARPRKRLCSVYRAFSVVAADDVLLLGKEDVGKRRPRRVRRPHLPPRPRAALLPDQTQPQRHLPLQPPDATSIAFLRSGGHLHTKCSVNRPNKQEVIRHLLVEIL